MSSGLRVHSGKGALSVTVIAIAATLAHGRLKADLVERQVGNPPAQLSAGSLFMVGDVAANRGPAGAGGML